jgi:hypothetical protein
MARSKQVYTVIGLLVLDEAYRNDFFANPHAAANKLVGSLTTDELTAINRIAGESGLTGVDKAAYVSDVKSAFGTLYSFIKCPTFPCPEVDSWDA